VIPHEFVKNKLKRLCVIVPLGLSLTETVNNPGFIALITP